METQKPTPDQKPTARTNLSPEERFRSGLSLGFIAGVLATAIVLLCSALLALFIVETRNVKTEATAANTSAKPVFIGAGQPTPFHHCIVLGAGAEPQKDYGLVTGSLTGPNCGRICHGARRSIFCRRGRNEWNN